MFSMTMMRTIRAKWFVAPTAVAADAAAAVRKVLSPKEVPRQAPRAADAIRAHARQAHARRLHAMQVHASQVRALLERRASRELNAANCLLVASRLHAVSRLPVKTAAVEKLLVASPAAVMVAVETAVVETAVVETVVEETAVEETAVEENVTPVAAMRRGGPKHDPIVHAATVVVRPRMWFHAMSLKMISSSQLMNWMK
jgi:hypothetical protein